MYFLETRASHLLAVLQLMEEIFRQDKGCRLWAESKDGKPAEDESGCCNVNPSENTSDAGKTSTILDSSICHRVK